MAIQTRPLLSADPDQLTVVDRPIAELRPDPLNPRKHSKRQISQIAKSIEAFGFSVPILLDANDKVVAGHGRLAACQLLGKPTVPTISLSRLTSTQAKAFMIADNRLTDSSSWDDQLLAQTLLDLTLVDLDFSIEATGFDMGDIDYRIATIGLDEDQDDDADQVPALGPTAISRLGDLWVLGTHRLFCGDSLDPAAYATLLEGRQARMLFTDPPYNVRIQGHVSGLGAHLHREFAMASGEMSAEQFSDFLDKALSLSTRQLVDGGMAFTFMDWRHIAALLAVVGRLGELKNVCVWVKHGPGMGSLYRSGHELVAVSKHGSAPHVNNVQLGRHGRNRSNVWRYPGANSSTARHGKEGDVLALHPTPKPVRLVEDAILDCSNRGDLVLDPFLGSGTTLIAAERAGRCCAGIELDPLYVDTIIRRFEKHSGKAAKHEQTGRTLPELAAMRQAEAAEVTHG